MALPTYSKIAATTLTSSQSTIVFNSIPQTFTDLIVHLSVRDGSGSGQSNIELQINGNSSNWSYTTIKADTNAVNTARNSASSYVASGVGNGATASVFSNIEFYIPNYSVGTYKSVAVNAAAENDSGFAAITGQTSSLWQNTFAAITSLTFVPAGGTFATNSTAYLYGVKNS